MRACKLCRRIVEGRECPVCKSNALTSNYQGMIVVFSVESEVAKKLGITAPGKYAIKV